VTRESCARWPSAHLVAGVIVAWLWCDCGVVVAWLWRGCGVVVAWLWRGCGVVVAWLWRDCGVVGIPLSSINWGGCERAL